MKIHKVLLDQCTGLKGVVVVIDVIRAFTTAAFAFSVGAEKIYLVSKVEEAFKLQKKMPGSLLVGEVEGHPIKGFDFHNSPSQIAQTSLQKKKLIMRTSAGTQGIIRCGQAKELLACSFVNAQATIEYIRNTGINEVTCVITNQNCGDEDLALADFLEKKLSSGDHVPITPYLRRVKESKLGKIFQKDENSSFSSEDLSAVLQANCFSFVMQVSREKGAFVINS